MYTCTDCQTEIPYVNFHQDDMVCIPCEAKRMKSMERDMKCQQCQQPANDIPVYEHCGLCMSCFELQVEIDHFEMRMEQWGRMIESLQGVADDMKALLRKMPVDYSPCPF